MDRLPDFTENEIRIYWPQIQTFFEEYGRVPERSAEDPYESKLGEVLLYLRRLKEREAENGDK